MRPFTNRSYFEWYLKNVLKLNVEGFELYIGPDNLQYTEENSVYCKTTKKGTTFIRILSKDGSSFVRGGVFRTSGGNDE